ncbi:MAG: nuclease-related domain-containing protein [Candidatus Cryosericum sp.]
MAQIHGKAGDATYRAGDRLMARALIPMLLMGALTYVLFSWGATANQPTRFILGITVVALGAWCLGGILRLETAADRYYAGAGGEHDVGSVLSELPSEFHVLHGIDFYRGDIDHIVIGPTGVFVVETKSHGGTVGVRHGQLCRNGQPLDRDYIRQAKLEARYVQDVLDPAGAPGVQAILVFARAKVRAGKPVHGVKVCALASLRTALEDGPPALSPEKVKQFAALMAKTDTRGISASRRGGELNWWLSPRGFTRAAGRPGFVRFPWPWNGH